MPQTLTTDLSKNSEWALCESALDVWYQISRLLVDADIPELAKLHDILWELRRRALLEEGIGS